MLTAGGTATLEYSNPSRAGERVTVEISNGSDTDPRTDSVEITLDQNGHGTASWSVPLWGWMFAHFDAPDAQAVTCSVQAPLPPPPPFAP